MNRTREAVPQSWMSLYIEMLFDAETLAFGTAFMVEYNGDYFLITNWHIVTGRSPETGKVLRSDGAIPNKIRIFFNEKNKLGSWIQGELDLYRESSDESTHVWYQHPIFGEKIDVVAIKIEKNDKIDFYPYELKSSLDIKIYPSANVSVVGFPFGKSSYGYLAIWATGFLATDIDIDYNDLPLFLIDCRGRNGQSGLSVSTLFDGHFFTINDGHYHTYQKKI